MVAIAALLISLLTAASPAAENGIPAQMAQAFVGQDLYLSGAKLINYQSSTTEHILVFPDGFSMAIGANEFFSETAVVWLETKTSEFRGQIRTEYDAKVYLEGGVLIKKGKSTRTTDLQVYLIDQQQALEAGARYEKAVVCFGVSGEVFVTAKERQTEDPRETELYKNALAGLRQVRTGPEFVVQRRAMVPKKTPEEAIVAEAAKPQAPEEKLAVPKVRKKAAKPVKAEVAAEEKKPKISYPVNIAPAGEVEPSIESAKAADGTDITTVIGRIYLWQQQDEEGGLLELAASSAVIFYSGRTTRTEEEPPAGSKDILAGASVKAIYMAGDVVVTEGQRTIRADELYYDFHRKKAIAVNAVMRSFDAGRGIPIYVRAAKLRQTAENQFAAEDIVLTSSEFYKPQISLGGSKVIITDTTTIDAQQKRVSDSSYDVQMHDVRLKVDDTTIFYWPFMRSNMQRPDIPIKSVHVGHDSIWGTSIESRWHLSRLLGLKEPEGVDSTLAMDYFGKRGFGTGAEIDYAREDYYGRLLGYIIRDSGQDRLGRYATRRNLEPDSDIRGRFFWQHRHFLPYNWQLTAGVGYASDENFIESYYRGEYNAGARQETYLHLKRLQDNWALSLLAKGRINDFADELEQLPSGEFHLTGQSLFDDRFTLYSDTQLGRMRQTIGEDHTIAIDKDVFTFASHRMELDMPLWARPFKIVPFAAGTFGYDDRSGFRQTLVDGSNTGSFGSEQVWLGEAGIRAGAQFWKVYPDVKSRLWDLNQLRHIISPMLTAVFYTESDKVVEQRDTLQVGVSQRLQTKRGSGNGQRVVDWMRLDMDLTWVNDSESPSDSGPGPDQFIWNRPIVPLRVLSAPEIFNGDLSSNLHRFEMFGVRRNYFGADYLWRLSDTMAILSDLNFDIQSGVVQQFNIGFSRLCWPNLSYYIGSRYLRRIEVLDEKGSNAFTFAATYVLDPRYTLVFSQQYDFDYGANIRSDITLIRRYHRIYCGLTYSADESLDRQAIVFSIWPQGLPELAIGPRRYMETGGSAGF
jgi:hypothetical protein